MTRNNGFEKQSLIYSAFLHAGMLLLAIFGLPEIWREHRESLPVAMTVEILPIGQTNVKQQEHSKPIKKSVLDKPITTLKARAASSSNKPKPKPVVKKTEVIPKPDAKKKPKPKEPEKPKPKEKPTEPEENLDDILKSIEDSAKTEEGKVQNLNSKRNTQKAVSDTYNPSMPLAMSEIDAIRQQFMQCWNVPAGARNAHELRVVLQVKLESDGTVTSVELAQDRARYYTDNFFRAAADSAMRAVNRCSPLKNLPTGKYETWKFLEISFDPKDMLY
jgi:outer membrane biosynthesis protein TonB